MLSLIVLPSQSAFGWGGGGGGGCMTPWIKNNAGWWSKGLISDNEFIKGIEYLVKSKIIKV
jgi:hypothetical protein